MISVRHGIYIHCEQNTAGVLEKSGSIVSCVTLLIHLLIPMTQVHMVLILLVLSLMKTVSVLEIIAPIEGDQLLEVLDSIDTDTTFSSHDTAISYFVSTRARLQSLL